MPSIVVPAERGAAAAVAAGWRAPKRRLNGDGQADLASAYCYQRDLVGRLTEENWPISDAQPSGAITTVTHDLLAATIQTTGNPGFQTTVYLNDAFGRVRRVADGMSGQTWSARAASALEVR